MTRAMIAAMLIAIFVSPVWAEDQCLKVDGTPEPCSLRMSTPEAYKKAYKKDGNTPSFSAKSIPLPSIRSMYCSSPCVDVSYAPDRHLGELATLVIFRQQCFDGDPPQVLDYRFGPTWREWNNTPTDAKNVALAHELTAIDDRRARYGERFGGWSCFCNAMSDRIDNGVYRDLERK